MGNSETIRDRIPAGAATAESMAAIDRQAFERLVARRDAIADRLQLGAFALNGGSLIALMSTLGGSGHAAEWLGFDQTRARVSACCFIIGLISAGLSMKTDQNGAIVEAGDALKKASSSRNLAALYSGDHTLFPELQKEMDNYEALPLVGFRYSYLSIASLNISQGAWLAGVLIPLAAAFGFSSGLI